MQRNGLPHRQEITIRPISAEPAPEARIFHCSTQQLEGFSDCLTRVSNSAGAISYSAAASIHEVRTRAGSHGEVVGLAISAATFRSALNTRLFVVLLLLRLIY